MIDLSNKVLVYVVNYNPCCGYEDKKGLYKQRYLSHEELIKTKPVVAILYFVDKEDVGKCWGDDWNDAPSCCNSGTSYTHASEYPEIVKIEVRYGETLKTLGKWT